MKNITFTQLNQEAQINRTTTPMMVSLTQSPDDETRELMIQRHTKFLSLPEKVKDKLASPETSQKIQAIGQKYGFELLRLANITRLIREYYFGEVRLEDFPTEIENRMGVSLLTAQEITRYIKSEIIDWDPWAEYIAKLPKMPVREIAQKFPKIANMEITAGYIELKGSEDLEDPTIKNWLKDYISHLGYDHHSQMDRTQYLFHSENGKNLSSQDREKLGIILKSFDENSPLPVDEENGEIVFESVSSDQRTVNNISKPTNIIESQPAPQTTNNFIKPYAPIPARNATRSQPAADAALLAGVADGSRPTLPPRQTSAPPQNFTRPAPVPQPTQEFVHPNLATQPNRQASAEIDKYFSAHESPDIPAIKIHSITEHNEPRMAQQVAPRQNIQRPVQSLPHQQTSSPQPEAGRPKYKIIDPFFSKPMAEPRLDGNIVDLSERE